MSKPSSGKIYLASQRGLFQTEKLRRFSTFNFGEFFHKHKAPFGNLYVVNEEALVGGHRIVLDVEEASHILLIPITGDISYRDEQGHSCMIEVGQVQIVTLPGESTFEVANPYEDETISFLQLWVKVTEPLTEPTYQNFDFDADAIENKMAEVVSFVSQEASGTKHAYPFSFSLGKFAGRKETTYHLKREDSMFFGFVVAGAFEMEGRLLHENDGLALWDTAEVELEALSENAIIIVIEITPSLIDTPNLRPILGTT